MACAYLAPGRLKEEKYNFQTSLGYIAFPYLKNKTNKQIKSNNNNNKKEKHRKKKRKKQNKATAKPPKKKKQTKN